MAKQKYWDGTKWVQVAPSMEEFGDKSKLLTTNKTSLVDAMNELFTDVSDGKKLVRNAITGKGGTVVDGDGDGIPTFAELVNGIGTMSEITFSPGDIIIYNSAAMVLRAGNSFTTFKSATMQNKGGYRVTFQLSSMYGGYNYPCEAQIYINGVARGQLRYVPNSHIQNFTEDFLDLKKGDVMEIKGRTVSGSYNCGIGMFEIKVNLPVPL